MIFGGDFGLTVASSTGVARATLVCTTPLDDFCAECVKPQFSNSTGKAAMTEAIQAISIGSTNKCFSMFHCGIIHNMYNLHITARGGIRSKNL